MPWQANPDEETTDWRAVCGRTGGWPWATRTVRRAGRARALLDPYHLALFKFRRPHEGGDPVLFIESWDGLGPRWIPAFAGMTGGLSPQAGHRMLRRSALCRLQQKFDLDGFIRKNNFAVFRAIV